MTSLTYSTQARDKYLRATTARTHILGQLNVIRPDARTREALGVTADDVRVAFETVWAVASHFEQRLHEQAEAERLTNNRLVDQFLNNRVPSPVPATDVSQAGEQV